ncbi:MAG: hypothetical protein AAFY81_06555, partial [Pseudomonadota bacterium]
QIGSGILVSGDVVEAAPGFAYRRLGRIAMSGVATGVTLYEPLPAAERAFADKWNWVVEALEIGDDTAKDRWQKLTSERGDDPAVALLESRMDAIRKGEVYVLPTK